MQGMSKLTLPNYSITPNESITVVLHNIQSLNKHIVDLKRDIRLKDADVICLTETWLRSKQNTSAFSLNGFQFYHATREDLYNGNSSEMAKFKSAKGGGVAVFINGKGHEKTVISLLGENVECIGVKFVSNDVILLTVYRPSSYNVSHFLNNLKKVIDVIKLQSRCLVCIGDFNEDAHSKGPIQSFMNEQNFTQIVDFNTTEGATILDHVYITAPLQAHVERLSTYYSYHDALIIQMKKK